MKKILSLILCCVFVFSLVSCETLDPNYGKSSAKKEVVKKVDDEGEPIKIPEIKSDDEIMPTYFDISLFDEENYADIYLGKKFEYKITYCGSTLEVPSSYKKMTKTGWQLMQSDEYNEDSQIMTGKSIEVDFVNEYDKIITAVFYNDKKSSVALKKCNLVKFIIKENALTKPDSLYSQFWANGVSNESAITDVIEYLGTPSHFYRISENKYYLDWFITESDKRSGITVYVDTAEDNIESIEFSYY